MRTPTKYTVVCVVALSSWFSTTLDAAYAPPPATQPPAAPATTTTSLTTTTTTTYVPSDAACGEWWSLALEIGFNEELLPALDEVMYGESRCDPTQYNATDPNGGSHGLMQINGFWCLPSRWYPLGYLQTLGVLSECADLYDPATNLRAAHALITYSVDLDMCTWHQWAWYRGCD